MDDAHRIVLRQQKVEELCATSIRALTGIPDLHFRGRRLYKHTIRVPVHAPHLQVDLEKDDFGSFRGATDSIALRIQHSNAELHAKLCPTEPIERMLFELLEQLRVETLAPVSMPGMAENLRYRFERWCKDFHHSGLTDSDIGILVYTIAQICWARLHGLPVLEQTEDLMEPTRGAMGSLLGHDLAGIKHHRYNQAAYAQHALSIAGIIADSIKATQSDQERDDDETDDDQRRAIFSLLLNFDDTDSEPVAAAESGESKVLGESTVGYRVYTRQYDLEVKAESLVRTSLLRELRQKLDKQVSAQGINFARLARLFASLLAVPQIDGWSFAQEEGYIDGRRLAQLVSSPTERRLFHREQTKPHAKCLVSILIDCSGSMKQHMKSIAMLVDVITRALQHAEVKTEVLGFTTRDWSGGRAQRDWIRDRQPNHPGRLNELCHIVYKDADTSWRGARPALAALLKPDLFREGIDGEAVEWACSRMLVRPEARKILIVISDGSPMDTATILANDKFYLDNHLKQVVERGEKWSNLEIYGLGVGLDLSPYYKYSLSIDISATLTNQVFFEIIKMLQGRHRR
ncbi:MAG: hypothetical protein QNI91_05560 [Arenicellales bacterium]|nr:hypothetical protein [Arenicellales bacterium]